MSFGADQATDFTDQHGNPLVPCQSVPIRGSSGIGGGV